MGDSNFIQTGLIKKNFLLILFSLFLTHFVFASDPQKCEASLSPDLLQSSTLEELKVKQNGLFVHEQFVFQSFRSLKNFDQQPASIQVRISLEENTDDLAMVVTWASYFYAATKTLMDEAPQEFPSVEEVSEFLGLESIQSQLKTAVFRILASKEPVSGWNLKQLQAIAVSLRYASTFLGVDAFESFERWNEYSFSMATRARIKLERVFMSGVEKQVLSSSVDDIRLWSQEGLKVVLERVCPESYEAKKKTRGIQRGS